MSAALVVLAQIAISVTAPDTVLVREPLTLLVRVESRGTDAPRVVAPAFAPFVATRRSESIRSDVSGGQARSTAEVSYELRATRPGSFTIAPFTARLGGRSARSSPLRIVVRPVAMDTVVPDIVARAPLGGGPGVEFHAAARPDTVYVGQQSTYQVGIFLGDEVRLRMRRNPEFIPPELRSMLAYDLAGGHSTMHTRTAAGQRYDVHVFQRALFPLAPGRFVMPAARLVYSLPLGSSFFSREETHTVRAESTVVVAVDPPRATRPDEFSGAVGVLSVAARLDSARGRVGDPVVLTVRVSGTGNVKLFPRPAVEIPWGALVPADERVQVDSSTLLVQGAKEFDWIVTPQQAGTMEVPVLRYSYFNPYTERYEIAIAPATTLAVAPGAVAPRDTVLAQAPLALRREFRGSLAPPLASRRWFWMLVLLIPTPVLGLAARRVARGRGRPETPAERLRRAGRTRGGRDLGALRRSFVGAIRDRVGVSADALTERGTVARLLRRAGVSDAVAAETERFLVEVDAALYARHESGEGRITRGGRGPTGDRDPRTLPARAWTLYSAIDREARAPREPRTGPAALLLLCAAAFGAASLAAALAPDESAAFARAADAYGQGDFSGAALGFAAVAGRVPRAADAWANAGTAAWMAGERAYAALGWQRALRLEPWAGDMRERVALFPGEAGGSIARVPPVPPGVMLALAAVVWGAAWTAAAVAAWRARPLLRWIAVPMGAAVVAGVLGLAVERTLAARDLRLVMADGALRVLPALVAERQAAVQTGEIAREIRREGVWTLVQLDGGRDGWIETTRLSSLARR